MHNDYSHIKVHRRHRSRAQLDLVYSFIYLLVTNVFHLLLIIQRHLFWASNSLLQYLYNDTAQINVFFAVRSVVSECIVYSGPTVILKGYPLEAKTAPKNWN